jgi:hypothetical protein
MNPRPHSAFDLRLTEEKENGHQIAIFRRDQSRFAARVKVCARRPARGTRVAARK